MGFQTEQNRPICPPDALAVCDSVQYTYIYKGSLSIIFYDEKMTNLLTFADGYAIIVAACSPLYSYCAAGEN